MTDAELLAEARAENAALKRMLERQGHQLDRMQDQLERALRELAALRRQLSKPPPDEPPPAPPPASPAPASGEDAASPGPGPSGEPPQPRRREKKTPRKKAKFGRNAIPANLPRVKQVVPIGPCPKCGGACGRTLRVEIVEVYDYKPAELVVREIVRPVSGCEDCQHIVTAPYPDDLAPRLRATPGLIGLIVYEKYGRHLPLYRVDEELERLGAAIPQATRDRWLRWAARQLAKLLDVLKAELFATGLLHTDGTGFPVVQAKLGRHLGQMAVYCNDAATIYDFTSTKEGCHQRRFLGLVGPDDKPAPPGTLRFVGHQVADAASVADQTYRDGSIVECGCNAHARRKFEEAEETDRRLAGEALAFWTELYAVEAEARDLTSEARLALRQERSAPVAADLRRWLDRHLGTRLPQEPLTKALNYLHNHWAALFRFLEDGRIPIDNNLAERQLKAIALGRKAYLCAGSIKAAERAALFYTFVRTCMQHDVDPLAWLTYVLPRIATTRPSRYADLLPMNWKQAQAAALAA